MPCFILDTNGLNELYAVVPNSGFAGWFQNRPFENFYTTTLNATEIRYGIEWLPEGQKKIKLERWWDEYFMPNFEGRILSFDLVAAKIHGVLRARNRRDGKPRPIIDSLIAAIAIAHGFGIVTRNTRDFAGLDIEIVDPWR